MIKLIDARWFQIFLCFHWNNMNFLSLFTRSKNRVEIELQQGTPEVQIKQLECLIHTVCDAPPGSKKNFRCALLVNFRSAAYTCKNGNCTSVFGTLKVHWTSGTEFLEASSLIGAFLILIISLAAYFQFCRFFCTSGVPCCSSTSSLFLLLVNKLKKFLLFRERHRKIWN